MTTRFSLNQTFALSFSLHLFQAAILQHTAEFIYQLEQDKTKLLAENCQLKRLLNADCEDAPLTKRVKIQTNTGIIESDSSDEGIQCQSSPKTADPDRHTNLKNELIEVRKVLDRERRLRMQLEEQVRNLEAQLYPERVKEIAQQVQLQFNTRSIEVFIN